MTTPFASFTTAILETGDEALLGNELALDVIGEHVLEESLGGVIGILGAVHVLGGPNREGVVEDVLARGLHAADLDGGELGIIEVGEVDVGDGVVGGAHQGLHVPRGLVLLGLGGLVGVLLLAEDGGLEGGTGAGALLAVDDDDLGVLAADLAPIGDGATEDALELLEGQVIDGDVLGDDRAHAHDGDLVVDELGGGIGVELGLGEDIGVADGHGAGGHGGEACAGAVAGAGDDAVGVLVHELLGRSLDEGLEGGGAVVGDLAHDARGGIGGTSGRGLRATAASQAETGHGGDTAGKAEEGATRAGIIEHGSPFESNIGVISRRTEKLWVRFHPR